MVKSHVWYFMVLFRYFLVIIWLVWTQNSSASKFRFIINSKDKTNMSVFTFKIIT